MSFWRDLNRGINAGLGAAANVVSQGAGVLNAVVPGLGSIVGGGANIVGSVIQAGQSKPTLVPDAGFVQGNVQFGDGNSSSTSNNTLLYIVGAVALFLILKKK